MMKLTCTPESGKLLLVHASPIVVNIVVVVMVFY